MDSIRARVSGEHGGLTTKVTGGAGYQLDAIKVFGNINGTLLGVTALIVLILLVIIYRSPIFWAIPFFTVLLAESTARGIGYLLAEAGVTINGQSGGILPVLVFGAGTDYALLLVSRYREELRRHEDKHDAIRVALQTAGPAILASGLTVIVALLTLSLAEVNGTAGLGPIGAMGVGHRDDLDADHAARAARRSSGARRSGRRSSTRSRTSGSRAPTRPTAAGGGIGEWVAARSRRVWVGGTLVLVVLALNVTQIDTGLTNTQLLPRRGGVGAGRRHPRPFVPERARRAHERDRARPRARRTRCGAALEQASRARGPGAAAQQGPPGTRLDVVLRRDPFATATFDQVPALRRAVKAAGGVERARRRPHRGGLRLPQVGDARQLRRAPARAPRRVRDPGDPAAVAAGAAAARRCR